MAELAVLAPASGGTATSAVLRLLIEGAGNSLAMLLADVGDGVARIEDAWPEQGLTGVAVRLPAALATADMRVLSAAGIRLPLAWTEACGSRPTQLATIPITGHDLRLVVAGCGGGAPDAARMAAAAEIVAQLLEVGEVTQREKDTARRIGTLIENLPVPLVFVDSRNLHIFLNDGARALLDLQATDLPDRSVAAALARLMTGAAAGGDRPPIASDPTGDMTFEIRQGAREYKVESKWIDEPRLAGRVWLFSEITVERAYQARLAELARLMQLTIENISEGVALIGEDMRLAVCNPGFGALFGYADDLLLPGSDLRALLRLTAERGEFDAPDPDACDPDAIVARFAEALHVGETLAIAVRRGDGRILDVRCRSLGPDHAILTARDVTDERRAARLKDDLVSTVSHELRTPITAIAGALKLVLNGAAGEIAPPVAHLLQIAHRNGERLSRLVDDLLDLDALQLGRMDLALAEHDLAALLAEAIEQNRPYAARFDVALELKAPSDPVCVTLDPFRFQQVMSNLLSNAAKFSPRGGLVTVALAEEGQHARIAVIDRGRGIAPEFRHRLFTRFAQERRRDGDAPAGTGLGLAISKSIVEQHGGTIGVESEAGIGTIFHVDLPLCAADPLSRPRGVSAG